VPLGTDFRALIAIQSRLELAKEIPTSRPSASSPPTPPIVRPTARALEAPDTAGYRRLVAPAAISAAKRRSMQAQRSKDTAPEVALRRELFRRGLRYRLHRQVLPGLRREIDIVFPGPRVAVDVRGCFWHSCPRHGSLPKHNRAWWEAKMEANKRRDLDTAIRLRAAGWTLIVVWEHERTERAANRIERAVRRQSGRSSTTD